MSVLRMSPDVNTKVSGLREEVKTILTRHDSAFDRNGSVLDYYDPTANSRDRADRLALLCAGPGEPERFADIDWINEQPGGVDLLFSGEPVDVRDRLRIYLYWGVRQGDDFRKAIVDFRSAMRSRDEDKIGLVESLRTNGSFNYEGWQMETRVETVDASFRLVDKTNREYRHWGVITLTLVGAPTTIT